MAPTIAPLVNSLADERVRSRANWLSGIANSLALIGSPAMVTGLIAAGAATVWIGLLCLGCLGTVAISARLRRRLTVEQDRVDTPGEETPAPATARPPLCAVPISGCPSAQTPPPAGEAVMRAMVPWAA
jgi:hypothetical protein